MTDRYMKLCEEYIVIRRKHIAKGESSDVVADKILIYYWVDDEKQQSSGTGRVLREAATKEMVFRNTKTVYRLPCYRNFQSITSTKQK